MTLSTKAQETWTQPNSTSRGTQFYNSSGALGYSVRTNTGGGWAWQFTDGNNNPYFHVEYPTKFVGIGTATPRGKLDVDGPGDIYLADDVNSGTDQSAFLPGHIYISPYGGSNVSYLQARRLNNSGTTSLRLRTYNAGTLTEAVHIEGNGNVGIGELSPFTKLAVKGDYNLSLEPSAGGPVHFYITTNSSNNIIGVNARTRYGLWDVPDPSKPSSFLDFSTYNINNPYYGGIAFFTRNSGASGIGTEKMVLLNNGNLGIGTTSPAAKLDVGANISGGTLGTVFGRLPEGNASGSGTFLGVRGYGTQLTDYSGKSFAIEHSFYGTVNNSINFYRGGGVTGGAIAFNTDNNSEKMRITVDGNVGIGTTNPDAKLAVKGTVHAQEVKVDLSVPGPDYVFEKDYNLPTLEEVKAYIDQHKHLPEIPSAREMEANGVNLGEMNMLLLRKIEELTLYVIEQNKQIAKLQERSVSPDLSGKKIEELTLYVIEQNKIISKQNERITSLESK